MPATLRGSGPRPRQPPDVGVGHARDTTPKTTPTGVGTIIVGIDSGMPPTDTAIFEKPMNSASAEVSSTICAAVNALCICSRNSHL